VSRILHVTAPHLHFTSTLTRALVLDVLLIAVLLWTAPTAIRRLRETGDPYLLTHEFFDDLLARFTGPGRMRFVFQPIMASLLAVRDGRRDAATHQPPFLAAFLSSHGKKMWREALGSTRDLIAIAILLDVLSQALILGEVHPGAALIVGPVLIAVPYALVRALSNRIARREGAAR
jgi:hypothetical protein